MSKASKLARMKNTVLETTGLTYNPSGGTVELNFTPDVTTPGVSVPLIVGGISPTSTGISSFFTNYTNFGGPGTACPYAQIVDHKPASSNSGIFSGIGNNRTDTGNEQYVNSEIGGNSFRWRLRDINTKIIDEIGVTLASGSGVTGGGGGNVFSLPEGTYYIDAMLPFMETENAIALLFNDNTSEILVGANSNGHTDSGAPYCQGFTEIKGRFVVSNSNDALLILHAAQTNDGSTWGFGYSNKNFNTAPVTGNIFAKMELWKIR